VIVRRKNTIINVIHSVITTVVLVAASFSTLRAQTMLELTDQLPPYLLSARVLSNGHFSITTNYTSQTKSLIYREDGTGNRPVNYTSHIHVKVDDVVYQMPYEADPGTDLPPPPNPMKVIRLFRDTVQQRPRINALLLALTSGGDSIRVTFSMEPVLRPSGGFIRMSAEVENAGTRPHNVGVLMLVDTKIGDNDRASIGTAFGYSGLETEFRASTPPGIPEFWIAFEGTPLAPGLTARGNLRATDLIEPDRFLFGNWVDDNGTATPGLFRVLWDERLPSGLPFTDSAILLLWEQQQLAARMRRLLAATEIGIVDSLDVSFGSGGGGGGRGSLGVAGPGSCFDVAPSTEDPCGEPGYHPYSPSTLSGLFVVTNTGTTTLNGLQVEASPRPVPGVDVPQPVGPVISSTLIPDQTGIGVQTFSLRPRLFPTTYQVPVHFVNDVRDTILTDSICINVPGVLGKISGRKTTTLPICPGQKDTIDVPILLRGPRCLPVASATIIGPPSPPARVLSPLPLLPAGMDGYLRIEAAPLIEGTTTIRVRVVVRDWESLQDGDTTWVDLIDTVDVDIIGRHAEFTALVPADTLVLPRFCVGDSTLDSMQIQNVGGCDLDITSIRVTNSAGGIFFVAPPTSTPLTIARTMRGQAYIGATGTVAGTYIGELEIESLARPSIKRITLVVTIDEPAYQPDKDTIDLDTICSRQPTAAALILRNPTGCDVRIDSIVSLGPHSVTIQPANGFTIGARSSISIALLLQPNFQGPIITIVRIYSAEGGDRDVTIRAEASNTMLDVTGDLEMGRVRVGRRAFSPTWTITLTHRGSRPITITGIRLQGAHPTDFRVDPPTGVTIPHRLTQFRSVTFDVSAAPSVIGDRSAIVTFTTDVPLCEPMPPVKLTAYGIQPLLDITRHDIRAGDVCLGGTLDTVITFRNLGNMPFEVSRFNVSGTASLTIDGEIPFTIDSGGSKDVVMHIRPSALGRHTATVGVTTDADWFTPNDTTVRFDLSSVLCATLTADTVDAQVGTLATVTLRLLADERTTMTNVQLLEALSAQAAPIDVTVGIDQSFGRYQPTVSGAVAGATTTVTPQSIQVRAPSITNAAEASLATLTADILLGPNLVSPLPITINAFADGFHRLRLSPGLLRADYCAFDQRRVIAVPSSINIVRHPQGVRLFTSNAFTTQVDVQWYTIDGTCIDVSTIHLPPNGSMVITAPDTAPPLLFVVAQCDGVVRTMSWHR
jgi:hypothetical protein